MESERHRAQMELLIETLTAHWAGRDDVYVGGNMFVYFSMLQVKNRDFRGPDFFVVLDTVRRERKAWVGWEEEKLPDLVIELTSESTAEIDRGEKKEIYARAMRVPSYFIFDPFTADLEAYRLDQAARVYEPVPLGGNGRVAVPLVGLELGLWEGTYRGITCRWLRWYTPEGELLSTGDERAQREAERAQKAEATAEAERTRREALERELAELRSRLGR